jgi:hypothetical protein
MQLLHVVAQEVSRPLIDTSPSSVILSKADSGVVYKENQGRIAPSKKPAPPAT